ncbi:hypothetical protein NC651_019704 [Populus alba x Populus x berolinensis]|nr:hypothetical protein NC651_019704 [Populus alba x Populus x berolinensis]
MDSAEVFFKKIGWLKDLGHEVSTGKLARCLWFGSMNSCYGMFLPEKVISLDGNLVKPIMATNGDDFSGLLKSRIADRNFCQGRFFILAKAEWEASETGRLEEEKNVIAEQPWRKELGQKGFLPSDWNIHQRESGQPLSELKQGMEVLGNGLDEQVSLRFELKAETFAYKSVNGGSCPLKGVGARCSCKLETSNSSESK